ncbi:M15 family metallopeptidase [Paenibacillus senegalensis]|uniref:M15 family metallopeptidase n=1 Tax=Paenibacillus senegalensis TaxID=1465766 RepID=UPI000287D4FD|nr:M15 family metallopeptidase [Paenibacillus senegalensis]
MVKSGIIFLLSLIVLSGCGASTPADTVPSASPTPGTQTSAPGTQSPAPPSPGQDESNEQPGGGDNEAGDEGDGSLGEAEGGRVTPEAVPVDTDPHSVTVMVNKEYGLPEDYAPTDLVYPDVRFTFSEKIEKRMLRQEAADALEVLFAAAEQDGIYLAGVSAYRSHSTQAALFKRYVDRDGEEKAKTYSAVPGHSEHETGLAIDVTSSDGSCAVQDCFGGTPEALWLAEHAHEHGFIIRYPEGKEHITGYQYEPWHLRYVGIELATELQANDWTLEEYYGVVPVSN